MEENLSKQMEAVIAAAIARGQIAGGSALVMRGGVEMAYAACGEADREAHLPIRRETIFRLYSMSKPITAAACMLLVERGAIDLGEPVSAYLPAYSGQKVWDGGKLVPAVREICVRDLLGMTAGLCYPGEEDVPGQAAAQVFARAEADWVAGREWDTKRVATALAACPLAFQPGTAWRYSTCADVLGAVIEVAAGKRFGEFLHEAFFEPLGMRDTGFYVPESKQARLANVYECTPKGMVRFAKRHLLTGGEYKNAPAFESGGAGLVSTIDDYARFARMLLCGGTLDGKRILSRRTVDCMTRPQVSALDMARTWDGLLGYGYGHLMRVLEKPGQANSLGVQGEYGWDGWLGTYFTNDPQNDGTLLFMVQRKDAGTMEVTRKLRNVVYAALS